jgi:hypothetical protein
MAIQKTGYYYDNQITDYIVQFMAIFTGLQVSIGNKSLEPLITVPIHYGHKDRVVAGIVSQNTQNAPIRLPVMSAYLRNLKLAENRMKGTGTERRSTYVPTGGLVPTDIKVVHQRMPVPYNLELDLSIYVSNTDQHFQILEQILPLFDPQLQIQTSDAPFDWTRLSHVKLTDINMETNHPIGTDRRIIQSTISFEMPIWIDTPADIRRDFIEQIYLRIGVVNLGDVSNYDIIAELDDQQIPYTLVATSTDLPLQ